MDVNHEQYGFTLREISYNGDRYQLALTPETYNDDGVLDFTGCWLGMLISDKRGTTSFFLEPDGSGWDVEPKGMDPGLLDRITEIISSLRK